jgi:hypothetical protein
MAIQMFSDDEEVDNVRVCGCNDPYCILPIETDLLGSAVESDCKAISRHCKTKHKEVPFILEAAG